MALANWMCGLFEAEEARVSYAQVDGHRMAYRRTGSGPELVLLHGLLGSLECWQRVQPLLSLDSTVYAPDAIGSGLSDRVALEAPAGPETGPKVAFDMGLEATADRVAGFLAAVGVRRADVLGTSHGGAVAMVLAARHPALVRSLILHAPANPFSDLGDPLIRFYNSRLGTWFAHQIPDLPRRLQDLSLGRMYGDPSRVSEGTLEKYMQALRVPGTIDHQLAILRHWNEDMARLLELLPRLPAVPTALLWGTRDRAVSLASAFELQKHLSDPALTLLPGSGHLPYEEAPAEFAAEVRAFLATVKRAEAAAALSNPGPRPLARPAGAAPATGARGEREAA